MDAKEQLNELYVLATTVFSPQQHVIYKPTKAGTGQALKIQLRLEPKWVATAEGGGYFDGTANKDGGLFLEIAPQGAANGDGYPTFLWSATEQLLRCKLGIPDITGLLVALQQYRVARVDVPSYLRDKNNGSPNEVFLFHKFKSGSTIITYRFEEESAILRISKGKDRYRSISLNLGEELIFRTFLEMALEAYLRVGKR